MAKTTARAASKSAAKAAAKVEEAAASASLAAAQAEAKAARSARMQARGGRAVESLPLVPADGLEDVDEPLPSVVPMVAIRSFYAGWST